ncbi:MAG: GNAT family N-acetyltransferase [Paracoccaceae bacterium]
MLPDPIIRDARPADLVALETLYPAAFPDEDLLPLLVRLFAEREAVASRLAETGSHAVGHLAVTWGQAGTTRVALLGPLAVAPDLQRQGIGTALLRDAVSRYRGTPLLVLGDPAYYGRFGFLPETRIEPPYPLPQAWAGGWQSLANGTSAPTPRATLRLPEAWMDPALWAP